MNLKSYYNQSSNLKYVKKILIIIVILYQFRIINKALFYNPQNFKIKDLDDNYLIKLLALASENSYIIGSNKLSKYKEIVDQQFDLIDQKIEDLNDLNHQGLQRIKVGIYRGETILAFRGTFSFIGIFEDISVSFSGPMIRKTLNQANEIALLLKPTQVTGHSLGGLIAEQISVKNSIHGASFNAPGLRSPNSKYDLLQINQNLVNSEQKQFSFEVHLTKNDFISQLGGVLGPEQSHITKPKWHKSKRQFPDCHRIEILINDSLGRLGINN